MNERAFRLDFFIAIAALLVSALTAGTLLYQTRVIGDQYAATIWLYLGVRATYGFHTESIELANDGMGPALIGSAQLSVDGKNVDSWNDYVLALAQNPTVRTFFHDVRKTFIAGGKPLLGSITAATVGPSTTIRPGDVLPLLKISFPDSVPASVFFTHRIGLDFCYCSLNGRCWKVHATPGNEARSTPQQVWHCTGSAVITSHATFPSPRPRRK